MLNFDFKKIKSNLNKILYIEGNEKKLNYLYSKAELLVYPSLYEGFGLPILESFANGCPVVCSNTSSLPEIGNDAATYFDPNNINSISNALETILNSKEKQNLYKNRLDISIITKLARSSVI